MYARTMRPAIVAFTLAALAALAAPPAAAAPILAAPGSPGFDAGLEAQASGSPRRRARRCPTRSEAAARAEMGVAERAAEEARR